MSQRVAPGRRLGPCELLEEIGRGGSAVVFRARHTGLGRDVAVKVIGGTLGADASFLARFRQEADLVSRLNHPHILPLLERGETGSEDDFSDLAYLVTPFMPGGNLAAALEEPRTTRERCIMAAAVAEQIGAALDHAHGHDVLHRDLKPSNILIDADGRFVLGDFGLARVLQSGASLHLTATGLVAGTPAYMAPEQALGQPAEPRTDLYGLAVVLYEVIAGRVPFDAETPLATMLAHVHQPPPAPRTLAPDVPRAVEVVLLHALAKAPDDRYDLGYELGRALRAAVAAAYGENALPKAPSAVVALPRRRTPALAARRPRRRTRLARAVRTALFGAGAFSVLTAAGLAGGAYALGPGRPAIASYAERVASRAMSPRWTEALPRDGAKNEPLQTRFVVRFSHDMDRASVEGAFSVDPPVPVAFFWDSRMLTVEPQQELDEGTAYVIAIDHRRAHDVLGRPLAGGLSRKFTTLTPAQAVAVPAPVAPAPLLGGFPVGSILPPPATPAPEPQAATSVPATPTARISINSTPLAPTYAPPTVAPQAPNTSQVAALVVTAEEADLELPPHVPSPAPSTTPALGAGTQPTAAPAASATATPVRQASPSPDRTAARSTATASGNAPTSSPTPVRAAAATATPSVPAPTPPAGGTTSPASTAVPAAPTATTASGSQPTAQPSPHAQVQLTPTAPASGAAGTPVAATPAAGTLTQAQASPSPAGGSSASPR